MVEPYVFGFVYATVIGHLFTKPVISSMWDMLQEKFTKLREDKGRYSSQPTILGIVERSLYYACFLFDLPAFVAVWLTLKTVAKSPRWANESEEGREKREKSQVPGRAIYQPFLVGNGLSLLYGGTGYAITLLQTKLDYLDKNLLSLAIAGPIAISLLAYLLSLVPLIRAKKSFRKLVGQIGKHWLPI